MSVTLLITTKEADSYLKQDESWMNLDKKVKENHIYNASVYMQVNWTCVDVDWSDPSTLNDDLKRSCAYYANADRIGVLNPSISNTPSHGQVIEETGKLGTMSKTTKWSDKGSNVNGNPLGSINSIMSLYCNSKSGTLIRV